MKLGNFNFLEPSGSIQACAGIALPLFYKPVCIAVYEYMKESRHEE